MKNLLIAFAFILGSTLGISAQQQAENDTKNQPVISFDKTEHDYGEVVKGGNGECVFTYTNTGKAPLVLTNARSSCGCTVPKWSREPLMPGQTATLTVRYNTNNVGPINKTVTVESNASPSKVVLRIKGKVVKEATE